MISKWQWLLAQLSRTLWVRASLYVVFSIGAALLAVLVERMLPGPLPIDIGADAVERILDILASSMLAVTTFSLSVMVAAYSSATSEVTPRATRLLMQDTTTQNVLGTFIGSFLYSLVGLIALSTQVYGESGRVLMFGMTMLVVALIVITMLRWMIAEGYGDPRTLERRAQQMEEWIADPKLMRADKDAEYSHVVEIDLADIKEPIVCCPNDPDDARFLSEVAGDKVDEVFIGSCMTNIGHFRAAGKLLEQNKEPLKTRLWMSPPTKMDQAQLMEEGYFNIYGTAGVRTEMPGCSLCMGNQARVAAKSTVLSTSTRNFPNRLGDGANVYLTSAELAAVGAILGKLPTPQEYLEHTKNLNSMSKEIYKYLNFDQMETYTSKASEASIA